MGLIKKGMIISAACCLTVSLVTGCGREQSSANNVEGAERYIARGASDARLINPAITDDDMLLAMGDLNVEFQAGRNRELGIFRSGRFSALNNQSMLQVYPNPEIAPYTGGYADNVIAMASMYMGRPYEYGSDRSEPSTFDCSDFTRWSYLASLGMDIPMDSRSQARYVQAYSNRVFWNIGEAKRGDLLFFISYHGGSPENYAHANKQLGNITHVGISLGDGRMIHTASAKTGGVRIDPVLGNHLQYRFVLGGSVLDTK